MKPETFWLLICVIIAVADVAGAIANYWSAKKNRTIAAIGRELNELKSDIEAMKSSSSENRGYQRRYSNNEGEDH